MACAAARRRRMRHMCLTRGVDEGPDLLITQSHENGPPLITLALECVEPRPMVGQRCRFEEIDRHFSFLARHQRGKPHRRAPAGIDQPPAYTAAPPLSGQVGQLVMVGLARRQRAIGGEAAVVSARFGRGRAGFGPRGPLLFWRSVLLPRDAARARGQQGLGIDRFFVATDFEMQFVARGAPRMADKADTLMRLDSVAALDRQFREEAIGRLPALAVFDHHQIAETVGFAPGGNHLARRAWA
ncbi:hypothetical protein E4T56_gene7627, partial [Termitomyces sp. T112]